ncbi:ACP S-malonyltransferase [Robbsia andropogonis]|uniref:ACP S-malonyltransferase n=1 Tax=Robbsia andropogonis TaxID=28092 RepID=A0A0F5JYJ9_9BURK|nr:malonate decarboxylase subunit epsilon [Robbsia andropogonis]KKB62976.1 ACP S-malonyltransferase [Robbsia andropogonis]
MTVAILCSGQGHQHPGMFDFVADESRAAPLFSHAARFLGEDPRDWVRNASADALQGNRAAQLLCTLHAIIAFARIGPALPARIIVAGYSVGEVAAWHVAGCLGAIDTLDLIVARADAMDAASHGNEGLLFVRGLHRESLDALCAEHDADIAIINPGDAYVLAGATDALATLAGCAREAGATRVVTVPVRVASHSHRLAAAVPVFRAALGKAAIGRGKAGTRLFSGIDGSVVLDTNDGLDKLARQIGEPVDWAACMAACVEAGATAFLELGPGRALAEIAAGAYPLIPARSVDDFRSMEGLSTWLARVSPA